jgi:ferredoxin-NADP reductase
MNSAAALPKPAWPQRLARAFAFPRTTRDYTSLVAPRLTKADRAGARFTARVIDATTEATGTRSLTLRPGRGWRGHRAGQFVTLYVNIDGVWRPRCYSISSDDRVQKTIRLTVHAASDAGVSRYLVDTLAAGAWVQISPAAGDFVLNDIAAPRLFLSAGSGVTPIMGMLASGAADSGEICHLHYARHRDDVIFADALRAMAAARPGYHYCEQLTGDGAPHLDLHTLDRLCPDWRDRETWLCGPERMLGTAEALWTEAGVRDRLHIERFSLPMVDDSAVGGGEVEFVASGRSAVARPGAALLQVAEQAGLNPAYGCRMGICHSCDCQLRSGAVRDLRTGKLTQTPGVLIQPCVNAAVGPVSLDL